MIVESTVRGLLWPLAVLWPAFMSPVRGEIYNSMLLSLPPSFVLSFFHAEELWELFPPPTNIINLSQLTGLTLLSSLVRPVATDVVRRAKVTASFFACLEPKWTLRLLREGLHREAFTLRTQMELALEDTQPPPPFSSFFFNSFLFSSFLSVIHKHFPLLPTEVHSGRIIRR